MRFLADESCDFSIVRALRSAGHDVEAVSETSPGATDDVLIGKAKVTDRVFLTEDKDFGELVFAHQRKTGGVIFIRFPALARSTLASTITNLVEQEGDKLVGAFTVVKPGRVKKTRRVEKL